MKKVPQPRSRNSFFSFGMSYPHKHDDGTWVEDESFSYLHGGYTRRAYVTCPDGKRRVVSCSIADTFFSIPARVKIRGRWVKGFITSWERLTTERPTGAVFVEIRSWNKYGVELFAFGARRDARD